MDVFSAREPAIYTVAGLLYLSGAPDMKKIFLTGASSGIGRATAELLVRQGHEVWGTARDPARLPVIERLHPVALDLANPESVAGVFDDALGQAGGFDVLINNAGSGYFGAAEALSMEELRRQFEVLVFGQIELCHRALAAMRLADAGLIINVTSLVAELPLPFMACYNAAKSAMAAYTMSLQLELAGSKVRLVDLQPGDINTGFNDAVLSGEKDDPRIQQTWLVADRNMQKAPKPELVARRIAELIAAVNPPPRIIVGDAFQTKIAPLIDRLLPQRVRLWGLRKYYGI